MDIEKLIQQQKDRLKTPRDDRSRAIEESDLAPQLDLQAALRWYYGQKTKRALTVVTEALARELRPAVSNMNEQLKDYKYEIDIQTAEFTSLLDAKNGKTYDYLKNDRQLEINARQFDIDSRIKALESQVEQRQEPNFLSFDTPPYFGTAQQDSAPLNSSEHARMIAAELHRLQEAPAREAAAQQKLQTAYIELEMCKNSALAISRPALPTILFTFRKSQKLIWKFNRKVVLIRIPLSANLKDLIQIKTGEILPEYWQAEQETSQYERMFLAKPQNSKLRLFLPNAEIPIFADADQPELGSILDRIIEAGIASDPSPG